MTSSDDRPAAARRYRFAFVLNTTIGNMTRYVNLRKFVDRDLEVEADWVPVTVFPRPNEVMPSLLPKALALRWRLMSQVFPTFLRLGRFDAVMLHLFEAEVACVARSYLFRRPALISSTDEAPVVDRSSYPLYPHQQRQSVWRQNLRLTLDRWRAARIDGFIPFSAWGARILEQGCRVPRERIHPIHVGLDLEHWKPLADRGARSATPRILFVGTDFERKGGPSLLALFESRFSQRAELHIVSANAPERLPPATYAYKNLTPNDACLVKLYDSCDFLVLPTNADLVPWSVLEAMSMRLAVISSDVGALSELVDDGVSGFLVRTGDPVALEQAIARLLDDADLCRRMGAAGRSRIERDFDAARNVPRILSVMKAIADRRAP